MDADSILQELLHHHMICSHTEYFEMNLRSQMTGIHYRTVWVNIGP